MTSEIPVLPHRLYDEATIATEIQTTFAADRVAVHDARVVVTDEDEGVLSFPHHVVNFIAIEVREAELNGRPARVKYADWRETVECEHVVVMDDGWVRVAEPAEDGDGMKAVDSPPAAHYAVEWKT